MIAKYKPARRLVTVASSILTLIVVALTFTRAADPAPAAKPAEAPPNAGTSEKAKRERTIRVLERELSKLDDQIASKQKEMDNLKVEFGITDAEAAIGPASGGSMEPETLRKLEGLRIEFKADFTRGDTFYRYLTNLSRSHLRKAIATASPDQQLIDLLSQLHVSEQKLAGMGENLASEHPDVKSARRVLETINKQVDDRLEGILKGLEAKTQADRARWEDLEKEVDRYKRYGIDQAIKRRPYYHAKRDLENLQLLRERLHLRLVQERIDAAVESEQ